jgi:hypothetical protein
MMEVSLDGEIAARVRETEWSKYPLPPALPGRFKPEYNRYGQYQLPHPATGRPSAFSRATTIASTLDETYNLDMWIQRQLVKSVLEGVRLQMDLQRDGRIPTSDEQQLHEAMTTLWSTDPSTQKFNQAADTVNNLQGGRDASEFGTAVHAWLEAIDVGIVQPSQVPDLFRDHVEAYREVLKRHALLPVPEYTERIVCNDDNGPDGQAGETITGTLDRLFRVVSTGNLVLGDVKGLPLDTRIPTPDGWTTMAEVQVGDEVFGTDGQPAKVTLKSQVKRIGTYIVRFDDGSEQVCDSEHIWATTTHEDRRQGREPQARGIDEIIRTLTFGKVKPQKQHRVLTPQPLDLPECDLPLEPYLLGAWLGDGTTDGGMITSDGTVFDILESDGWELGAFQTKPDANCSTRTVYGLRGMLRAVGLLGNKSIPNTYLRASIAQRTRLLQGLMDTDGGWNVKRRSVGFTTTSRTLADQVMELLLSLGQRPNLNQVTGMGFGKPCTSWRISFSPIDIQPFRHPEKARKATEGTRSTMRSRSRCITTVEPGPDVETVCIGVDSPDHTYLCGDRMIPTHNTSKAASLEWGALDFAIQLAIYRYANHMLKLDGSGWEPMPQLTSDTAYLMHIPSDDPQRSSCVALNVGFGHEALRVAVNVRDLRRRAKREGLTGVIPVPTPDALAWAEARHAIQDISHPDELATVWEQYEHVWTDELTTLGQQIAALLTEGK